MKKAKRMTRITAVILVLIFSITILVSCGGGEKLSGKYNLVSMTSDGETIKMADYIQELKDMYAELEQEFNEGDLECYIEFIDGGKCNMVMFGEPADGTYKVSGKTVEITADGETEKLTIDGNKLTLELDGEKLVYEK